MSALIMKLGKWKCTFDSTTNSRPQAHCENVSWPEKLQVQRKIVQFENKLLKVEFTIPGGARCVRKHYPSSSSMKESLLAVLFSIETELVIAHHNNVMSSDQVALNSLSFPDR
jgi:hypothetical protein